MTPKQATRLIASAFIVMVAIVAWRHVKTGTTPPPSAFVYPTAMFGGLALLADLGAPGLGGVLALALTVGIGFRAIELGTGGAGSAAAGAVPARRSPTAKPATTRRQPRKVPAAVQARRGR